MSTVANESSWIEHTTESLVERYGVAWRSVPRVYLSCSMSGDASLHDPTYAEHERISQLLCPEAILISPYRGQGKRCPVDVDVFQARPDEELTYREVNVRDLRDVHRVDALLVDLKPQVKTVPLYYSPSDDSYCLTQRQGAELASGGWLQTYAPLTGMIVECYEAWRVGKPVVAFNGHVRSSQANSPWLKPFITKAFGPVEEAIAFLKRSWLI